MGLVNLIDISLKENSFEKADALKGLEFFGAVNSLLGPGLIICIINYR